MQTTVNLWPLLGVLGVVVGFVLRFNPPLVVALAAVATGIAAQFSPAALLAAIGTSFLKARALSLIILLPLAVIGLLERHGLRLYAQNWIARFRNATVGRLLTFYLFIRETTAALGLTSLGGHPQMVRPLLAPMAEGSAEKLHGRLPHALRQRLLAIHPKRWTSGLFWGLLSLALLVGDHLPPAWVGAGVLLMAVLAGCGAVGSGRHESRPERETRASAGRLGNRLFIPALAIPVVTVIGSVLFKDVQIAGLPLLRPKERHLRLSGPRRPGSPGADHAWPGVGRAVAHLATAYVALDLRLVAVVVYVVGMAAFTVIMGNGFAAFPVMTGGIGVPVLVGVYGADPAVMAAIGMFSGYCGTLMTPMAARRP